MPPIGRSARKGSAFEGESLTGHIVSERRNRKAWLAICTAEAPSYPGALSLHLA